MPQTGWRRHEVEAVGGKECATGGGGEGFDERFGELGVLSFLAYGRGNLPDGGVEIAGDEIATLVEDEAPGKQADLGVAGFDELKRLANVLGKDEVGLEFVV